MHESDLVGAWRLDQFTATGDDGRRKMPYGDSPSGLLIYSDGGLVSAVLSHTARPRTQGASLESASATSTADKAAAFDTYTSYAGRYTLTSDGVSHRIEHALVPSMVGTTLHRSARFDGEQLVLRYPVVGRRQTYTYELRWSRA